METTTLTTPLTAKDFQTDQEVRWCPGCGDYSILKQVHTILPQLGLKKENIVFETTISGVDRQGKLMTKNAMEQNFDFDEVEWLL